MQKTCTWKLCLVTTIVQEHALVGVCAIAGKCDAQILHTNTTLYILYRLGDAATRPNSKGIHKLLSQAENHKEPQGGTGVSSYFRRQEVALTRYHWQVMRFSLSKHLTRIITL